MSADRIKEKFDSIKAEKRTGLILYLTTGFPDLAASRTLVPALAEAGADAIELGVPFSDPLADGATIQASSFQALKQGVTLQDCLDLAAGLRPKVPDTPLILMGYYNPIYRYGLERFCKRAREATVDGIIVPDLPVEEAGPLLEECRRHKIHLIPLLAPTSTEARIEQACATASGFIYCVSVTGVTGSREAVPADMHSLVSRVRRHTPLPLAVGFGISKREHMEAVGRSADAAIVGSALIKTIQEASRDKMLDRASRFVRELRGLEPALPQGGE
ncbi:MAG: tryptophan synthase subunit alpha [SAR202 cluster bacterium]|nr:tryptophan synthase subunit alpha [SAR202 cluster bacterium]